MLMRVFQDAALAQEAGAGMLGELYKGLTMLMLVSGEVTGGGEVVFICFSSWVIGILW